MRPRRPRVPAPPYANGYLREHFLADLVTAFDLKQVVELGVWKGRTFLHLLCHCPRATVHGVDTWTAYPERAGTPGGETYAKWDMSGLEKHVRQASMPFRQRAQILKMDTVAAAGRFAAGSVDLVFVDADHTAAGVSRDLDAWEAKLRQGGFLTGHDIDWPTVREVVAARYPDYRTGPDNVWWVRR